MSRYKVLKDAKGNRVTVIKRYPYQTPDGDTRFGVLNQPMFRVVLCEQETGSELRLTLSLNQGLESPRFSIQYPGTVDYPRIWVGSGKRRQQIPDVLADKVEVPGRKDVYDDLTAFCTYLQSFLGPEQTEDIINLFVSAVSNSQED